MKIFEGMENKGNDLYISKVSVLSLKDKYKTPLYIIDEKLFRKNCKEFVDNFKNDKIKTTVAYASKAFLNVATAKLIKEEGLSLDVVSGGEYFTALKSDFPTDKIYFHGNNKLKSELEFALKNGLENIVVDNWQEYELLFDLLKSMKKNINVFLRLNVGVEAHTHEYIKTAKNDSKFGESIYEPNTLKLIKLMNDNENMKFVGFHSHIGSQIFEEESFIKAADILLEYASEVKKELNIDVGKLNLGGGFGVYYTEKDKPFDIGRFLKRLTEHICNQIVKKGLQIKEIIIEPGRSLICNAGSTIYDIGGIKTTFGGKNYIFIDGGMTDNIRPVLYGAEYECGIVNKLEKNPKIKYTVAGKCCESGDVLIKECLLPKAEKGDTLIITSTGAYTNSMSSNYNKIERPAVVFVNSGRERLVVKRESYEDLIKNDIL